MQEKTLILSFENIRASDLPLVGGKGANLGELTYASFPVPPGFCLTTEAFTQFIDSQPEIGELYDLLDTVTGDNLDVARQVGQTVRDTLLKIEIPQNIVDEIRQEWQKLGDDEAYAVRSSATAEDLPDASFAGQQDTYLNVIGIDSLLDAVRRCWVSLFTDRAILYRYQNNFSHKDVQLSVVVQQMVMAEKSGILFTADPLTGHRHTLAIDASFGLGEALVSGLVSPDAYRVDKRNNTVIERRIADKKIALYPEKEGGIRQEDLSETQGKQTVLTDEQILKLADMGCRIEAHYQSPQDIEWAIVDDKMYLLQARPITSLFPIDGLKSPDDTLHIFFSMGHQQNMTNAMSPLGISFIQTAMPFGHANNAIESSLARANGGRIFFDLTQLLHHPIFKRGVLGGISQFDALAPDTLRAAMQRPEFQSSERPSISWSAIRLILHTIYRIQKAFWREDLSGIAHRVNDISNQYIAAASKKLHENESGEAQISAIIEILPTFFPEVLKWVPYFVAGELAKRFLTRIANPWADEIDLEALDLGLLGNVVTDMNLELGDLADIARQSPQLMTLFENLGDDGHAWLAQASQLDDTVNFITAWDTFIAKYGARGSAEVDIMSLHWYEEPLLLLQVIASYLQKDEASHRVQHQKLVDEREKAIERLRQNAKQGIFGWLRSRFVGRLIHVLYEASVLREHHKFMMVKTIVLVKEALKTRAIELTADKKLSQPDDIWFLTLPELLALYRGEAIDTIELTSTRRKNQEYYQKISPPMVLTSDGETPVVNYQLADAPEGALLGNPVSPGIVEGIVHVIHNPQTETLLPGEILVAPFTDPGWTPLFINAGGLIMEIGGIMTHGSVVAREYAIPAIVGVRDATKLLKTGQKVRIDGNRGTIEIL